MMYKAGAIILDREHLERVLLIYRKSKNDWTFPKGHVEDGENYVRAATREVTEETGLTDLEVVAELPDLTYKNDTEGVIVVKMFLMVALSGAVKPEYEGDNFQWVSLAKGAAQFLTYDNLKSYIQFVEPGIQYLLKKTG